MRISIHPRWAKGRGVGLLGFGWVGGVVGRRGRTIRCRRGFASWECEDAVRGFGSAIEGCSGRRDVAGEGASVLGWEKNELDGGSRPRTRGPRATIRGVGTHSMETERAPVALAAFLARTSPAAIPACRSMTNGRPVKWREIRSDCTCDRFDRTHNGTSDRLFCEIITALARSSTAPPRSRTSHPQPSRASSPPCTSSGASPPRAARAP